MLAERVVGSAAGESLETDTEMPHDRGAGVLALTLDVPSVIVVPIDYSVDVAISRELGAETVAT